MQARALASPVRPAGRRCLLRAALPARPPSRGTGVFGVGLLSRPRGVVIPLRVPASRASCCAPTFSPLVPNAGSTSRAALPVLASSPRSPRARADVSCSESSLAVAALVAPSARLVLIRPRLAALQRRLHEHYLVGQRGTAATPLRPLRRRPHRRRRIDVVSLRARSSPGAPSSRLGRGRASRSESVTFAGALCRLSSPPPFPWIALPSSSCSSASFSSHRVS